MKSQQNLEKAPTFKPGDYVHHSLLGDGEVTRLIPNENGVILYIEVDWDRDPPQNFNLGANPYKVPVRELTLKS